MFPLLIVLLKLFVSVNTKMGKDGKPRGKMSSYAYFVQTCREEHKRNHPDERVGFSEFSKKCSERWKVWFFIEVIQMKETLRQIISMCSFFFSAFSQWVPRRRPDLRNWPNGTSCATTKRWWAMSRPGELRREAEERRSLRTHLPPRGPRKYIRIPLQNKSKIGQHEL